MSKKEYFLVGLVVVLVGVYAVFFTDWLRPKVMHIEHSARTLREAWTGSGARVDPTGKQELGNVTFTLHRKYKLTSVKVVPLADFLSNKYAPATWELGSKSGSDPVEGFAYGMPIPGMAAAREFMTPESLQPDVEYRLFVEAGGLKGEHDFTIGRSSMARR